MIKSVAKKCKRSLQFWPIKANWQKKTAIWYFAGSKIHSEYICVEILKTYSHKYM